MHAADQQALPLTSGVPVVRFTKRWHETCKRLLHEHGGH